MSMRDAPHGNCYGCGKSVQADPRTAVASLCLKCERAQDVDPREEIEAFNRAVSDEPAGTPTTLLVAIKGARTRAFIDRPNHIDEYIRDHVIDFMSQRMTAALLQNEDSVEAVRALTGLWKSIKGGK